MNISNITNDLLVFFKHIVIFTFYKIIYLILFLTLEQFVQNPDDDLTIRNRIKNKIIIWNKKVCTHLVNSEYNNGVWTRAFYMRKSKSEL